MVWLFIIWFMILLFVVGVSSVLWVWCGTCWVSVTLRFLWLLGGL